jgi:hypothetical protein
MLSSGLGPARFVDVHIGLNILGAKTDSGERLLIQDGQRAFTRWFPQLTTEPAPFGWKRENKPVDQTGGSLSCTLGAILFSTARPEDLERWPRAVLDVAVWVTEDTCSQP